MNILLFALGALTMIIELSIPRLIAPAYGNTMFSWTAIIAVVLSAMTIGYYIGGRISAKKEGVSQKVIYFSAMSAAWTIGLAILGEFVVGSLSFLNILTGPLVVSALFAVVPTFLNAAAVPMIISSKNSTAGVASGNSFSISTIGSIVGVIITGYLLLPLLGITGALLTGSAFVFIALFFNKNTKTAFAGITAISAVFVWSLQIELPANVLTDHSNGYHRIKVVQDKSVTPETRTLYLDHTMEGVIHKGVVTSYLPGVKKLVDEMTNIKSALVIGGGGFAVPRYIKSRFPNAVVDVAELDGDVEQVGRDFLELGDNINILIGDGRNTLASLTTKYDLILNDAFKGYRNMPFHLTTSEFNNLVKSRLKPNGLYAINVRGLPTGSYLTTSLIKTLNKSFNHLRTMRKSGSNTITLASDDPIYLGQQLSATDSGLLLTDNRAPTEFLIIADLIRKQIGY